MQWRDETIGVSRQSRRPARPLPDRDRVVAQSNVATVFRATDLRDGREVAIKVPHPEMESDPTFADRFTRELEIGEQLDHPGS